MVFCQCYEYVRHCGFYAALVHLEALGHAVYHDGVGPEWGYVEAECAQKLSMLVEEQPVVHAHSYLYGEQCALAHVFSSAQGSEELLEKYPLFRSSDIDYQKT